MEEFNTPSPTYIIAEVGTRIYDKEYKEDTDWIGYIENNTEKWDINSFKYALSGIEGLRLQEEDKQNRFKLSYYIDDLDEAQNLVSGVKGKIHNICEQANIIYSIDEAHGVGLIDILPQCVDKQNALEFLRKKLSLPKEHVIYCGDSGNDLQPLTAGYKAILVRNAIDEVREEVSRIAEEKQIPCNIYFAKGTDEFNGYYVSGIIEGLIHFGIFLQN
ncbi:MAG: HAD-IIB family hydrolase [Candidatus Woesearchaeota archaeon]